MDIEKAEWPFDTDGPRQYRKGPGGSLAAAAFEAGGDAVRMPYKDRAESESLRRTAQHDAKSHGFRIETARTDGYIYARLIVE